MADDPDETHGINDRAQLAHAEAELRRRTNEAWLAKGVTMVDPAATYIDTTVTLAADVTLFPGTILQGRTAIGEGVEIGPGCRLVDCTVGEHTTLEHTVARLSDIGADCVVGPYAALEPGTNSRPGRAPAPFYTARRTRRSTADDPHTIRPLGRGDPWSWSRRRGCTCWRGGRTSRWPRRSPSTSASSSGTRTSWSSPTARSTRGSARTCAAPTSSSSRPTAPRRELSVNDVIMEQLIMIDAARRASAKRITAVIPNYGYARQDRKAEDREPITAKLVANMFAAVGTNRLMSVDLHSGPDPGLLRRPGRPPHRHAGARRLHPGQPARRPRRRVAGRRPGEGGRALHEPAPRRPRHRAQAPGQGREEHRGGRRDRRRRRRAAPA